MCKRVLQCVVQYVLQCVVHVTPTQRSAFWLFFGWNVAWKTRFSSTQIWWHGRQCQMKSWIQNQWPFYSTQLAFQQHATGVSTTVAVDGCDDHSEIRAHITTGPTLCCGMSWMRAIHLSFFWNQNKRHSRRFQMCSADNNIGSLSLAHAHSRVSDTLKISSGRGGERCENHNCATRNDATSPK